MPRTPAGQVRHPPARLSSHTKAKLDGRLTDPSLFHLRLSVRFAIRRLVDTLIPLLGPVSFWASLVLWPPSLKLSADEALPISHSTHTQSFSSISKTSICRALRCPLLRFAQSTCSSGLRRAASIKRELLSAESTCAATPYSQQTRFLHQRGS